MIALGRKADAGEAIRRLVDLAVEARVDSAVAEALAGLDDRVKAAVAEAMPAFETRLDSVARSIPGWVRDIPIMPGPVSAAERFLREVDSRGELRVASTDDPRDPETPRVTWYRRADDGTLTETPFRADLLYAFAQGMTRALLADPFAGLWARSVKTVDRLGVPGGYDELEREAAHLVRSRHGSVGDKDPTVPST